MTREELAAKVEWEGGVAEAITGYGLGVACLPENAPDHIVTAWRAVYEARASIELIEEWLGNGSTAELG